MRIREKLCIPCLCHLHFISPSSHLLLALSLPHIKFCFQFNRQGTHKTLDKELVVELLPLVVQDRIGKERVTTFCKFLSQSEDIAYKNITLDQWMSFYDFSMENPDDLSGYDEDESAWPCMIDDYVDFMEQMQE